MMKLSVVIPARNAAVDLPHLLAALLPQLTPDDECVLVDDASEDETGSIALRHSIQVLRLGERSGPAAARNHGVQAVSGTVVVFLDADVVPHPGLIHAIRQHLRTSSEFSAVIGSYDKQPHSQATVSRFRNLLHCYTHHHGNREAATFWAGCGAIRREDFLSIGGFDAELFPIPSIEDIELGMRLKRFGKRILLDPTLQVQHRKVWTLATMLRTDLKQRAIPWTHLLLSAGDMPQDLNLKLSQRASGAAVAAMVLALLLIPFAPSAASLAAAALLTAVLVMNWHFYRFLAECGGWPFALASIPAHLLYFLCSVCGFAIANVQFRLHKESPRRPKACRE